MTNTNNADESSTAFSTLTKDHNWERKVGFFYLVHRIVHITEGQPSSYLFIAGPGLIPLSKLAAFDRRLVTDTAGALESLSKLNHVWCVDVGDIFAHVDTAMQYLWVAADIYTAGMKTIQNDIQRALGFNVIE